MLELIKSTPKEKPDYFSIHNRAFIKSVSCVRDRFTELESVSFESISNLYHPELLKIIYHGVKVANLFDIDKEDAEHILSFFDLVKGFIAMATPKEVMQVFPIRKIYDGSKWESKDYFSTMEAIQKYGLDIPIGLNIDDFIWEYMNDDLMDFEINRMSVMSKIYKQETGKGIMEDFLEDKGISPMYLRKDKQTGKEFLYDVENCRTHSIKKSLPKGWKVIRN